MCIISSCLHVTCSTKSQMTERPSVPDMPIVGGDEFKCGGGSFNRRPQPGLVSQMNERCPPCGAVWPQTLNLLLFCLDVKCFVGFHSFDSVFRETWRAECYCTPPRQGQWVVCQRCEQCFVRKVFWHFLKWMRRTDNVQMCTRCFRHQDKVWVDQKLRL